MCNREKRMCWWLEEGLDAEDPDVISLPAHKVFCALGQANLVLVVHQRQQQIPDS